MNLQRFSKKGVIFNLKKVVAFVDYFGHKFLEKFATFFLPKVSGQWPFGESPKIHSSFQPEACLGSDDSYKPSPRGHSHSSFLPASSVCLASPDVERSGCCSNSPGSPKMICAQC